MGKGKIIGTLRRGVFIVMASVTLTFSVGSSYMAAYEVQAVAESTLILKVIALFMSLCGMNTSSEDLVRAMKEEFETWSKATGYAPVVSYNIAVMTIAASVTSVQLPAKFVDAWKAFFKEKYSGVAEGTTEIEIEFAKGGIADNLSPIFKNTVTQEVQEAFKKIESNERYIVVEYLKGGKNYLHISPIEEVKLYWGVADSGGLKSLFFKSLYPGQSSIGKHSALAGSWSFEEKEEVGYITAYEHTSGVSYNVYANNSFVPTLRKGKEGYVFRDAFNSSYVVTNVFMRGTKVYPTEVSMDYVNPPAELEDYTGETGKKKFPIAGIYNAGMEALNNVLDGVKDKTIAMPWTLDEYLALVNKVLAENQGKSQEEINKAVQDAVNQMLRLEEILKQQTEEIIQNQDANFFVVNTWLEKIFGAVSSISLPITDAIGGLGNKISKLVENAVSLEKKVDEAFVKEQVVEEVGGKTPNDDDKKPNLWKGGGVVAAGGFLAKLLGFLATPLSLILEWLDYLSNDLDEVMEFLRLIFLNPDGSSILREIVETLLEILDRLRAPLELDLPDIVLSPEFEWPALPEPDWPALPDFNWPAFPEFNWPSLPDLDFDLDIPVINVTIFENVTKSLKEFFVIDGAKLEANMEKIKKKWRQKFSLFYEIADKLQEMKVEDKVVYPVVKMENPEFLKQFYPVDEIILFDGEQYAEYFSYAREIIRCMLWVLFAYAILRHFNVQFKV